MRSKLRDKVVIVLLQKKNEAAYVYAGGGEYGKRK